MCLAQNLHRYPLLLGDLTRTVKIFAACEDLTLEPRRASDQTIGTRRQIFCPPRVDQVIARPEPPSTQPSLLSAIADLTNETAWWRFTAAYESFILGCCLRAGLDATDAEDVKQSVLAALVRAMPRFRYDPALRFRGYLTAAVVNAVRSFRSKRLRQPGATGRGEAGLRPVLEAVAGWEFVEEMAASLDSRLGRDLRNLSIVCERVRDRVREHTWQAYWLTAAEGIDEAEVAARLGISAGSVYTAKYRVGKMMREAAAELGSGAGS